MDRNRSFLKATLIASACSVLAVTAHAAGLGGIEVRSGIGQPLRAQIPIRADEQELGGLSVRIASPDAFREAGIEYDADAMRRLRLTVDRTAGQAAVQIVSTGPVNEPFMRMLVELDGPTGNVIRAYTVLLDPVDDNAARESAQSPVRAPRVQAGEESSRNASAQGARYTVENGDTLHAVARQYLPQGTSLDQAVVALFRNNRDAFIGENMNRLQAGAIMSIPEAEQMRAIAPTQARREIEAHAAEFEAYRQGIATGAARQDARSRQNETASRSEQGRIAPRVVDTSEIAESVDRVQVSSDAMENGAPDNARLDALEEELASREQALQETNERLLALESSIRDLQALLELRNRALAQLQQQLGEEGVAVGLTPEASVTDGAGGQARSDDGAAAAADTNDSGQTDVMQLLRNLLNDRNVIYGAGGLAVLLLVYALYRLKRRRSEDEAEVAMSPQADRVAASAATTAVPAAMKARDLEDEAASHALDTQEGVDPVAEADVYMAYGRDSQAAEILQEALAADSANMPAKLKLLEVHARTRDLDAYEALARDVREQTGARGHGWREAARMGREIDPDNALYREGGQAEAGDSAAVASASQRQVSDPAEDVTREPTAGTGSQFSHAATEATEASPDSAEAPESARVSSALDAQLDFAIPETDPVAETSNSTGAADEPMHEPDLDFDTFWHSEQTVATSGQPDGDEATAAAPGAERQDWLEATVVGDELRFEDPETGEGGADGSAQASQKMASEQADDDPLDFALDFGDESGGAGHGGDASGDEAQAPAFDFSGIDLDLDSPPTDERTAPAAEPGQEISEPFSEEVETKLELAQAYEEMGDKEGALELIEEVLAEGSTAQREQASRLRERLG